jgi:Na+-driven multidrug efflux pump
MLSMFFQTLCNAVDAYWVGKLSPEAMAAVSISQVTLFEAERILGQSFVLSAIIGAFFTAVSLVFRHQLLAASGATFRRSAQGPCWSRSRPRRKTLN